MGAFALTPETLACRAAPGPQRHVALDQSGVIVAAGWASGPDQTAHWIEPIAAADAPHMVDARLVVSNVSRQRLCERQVVTAPTTRSGGPLAIVFHYQSQRFGQPSPRQFPNSWRRYVTMSHDIPLTTGPTAGDLTQFADKPQRPVIHSIPGMPADVEEVQAQGCGDQTVMGSTPVDVSRFAHTLPYASEAFGLYQPLLGWRGQRSTSRFTGGLAAVNERVITAVSRGIAAAVQANVDHEVQSLKAGLPVPIDGYSPLIASQIGDLVSTKLRGADLQDRNVWADLLTRDHLDALLVEEVLPQLEQGLKQSSLSGEQRQIHLEALARRESVIAGALNYLATQRQFSVLRSLFTPSPVEQALAQLPTMTAMLDPLSSFDPAHDWNKIGLSPIGIVHLFREYFFEFDTFLGPPVQHVWLSPGGTVELIEISTRKTTIERAVEQATDTATRTDKSTTSQDDIADAVKEDNESNLKLGASVKATERWGWGDATESASLDYATTEKAAREQTHKQMRQQSTTLSSEIKTNFKTTFRTVTETTDTTNRRYVLANTTDKLINYELRRKMRQVGVQIQDLGSQLCWQTYIDDAGADLGIAKLVHIAAPPDFSSLGPINELTPPDDYSEEYSAEFAFYLEKASDPGAGLSVEKTPIQWLPLCYLPIHPKDGFEYFDHGTVKWTSQGSFTLDITHKGDGLAPDLINRATQILGSPEADDYLLIAATYGYGHYGEDFSFTVPVRFTATPTKLGEIANRNNQLLQQRDQDRDRLIREAYMTAVADRVKVASHIEPRSYDDLRNEERIAVYRKLIQDLFNLGIDLTADRNTLHKAAELISSIFDVDAMLYFVAPEWWRPHTHTVAEEPSDDLVPPPASTDGGSPGAVPGSAISKLHMTVSRATSGIDNSFVAWAGSAQAVGRDNYEITADSAPAHLGASLGWLLQLDGDNQRNAFLNAPWVKAVMPIRPGKELEAISWLTHAAVEGSDGLDDAYQEASQDEEQQIIAGLEGASWPAGPDRDRYTDFARKIEDDPNTTFVTVRDALLYLAIRIQAMNQKGEELVSEDLGGGVKLNYLRPDMVYEHGFNPLDQGFQANSQEGHEYEPFTQWVEVLPTDQVVPVEVTYDPKTGRQD
jgi:hypothetical protein